MRSVGGVMLFVLIVWTLAPLYWMVATSLKENSEIYGDAVTFWPSKPTLDNYRILFEETNFLHLFPQQPDRRRGHDLPSLIFAALGAYALTRLNFPGRRFFAAAWSTRYLMPQLAAVHPAADHHPRHRSAEHAEGLVFSYLGFTVPFCTWLLMGYFMSIPIELEESAMVDGCGRLGVLFRIVMPLTCRRLRSSPSSRSPCPGTSSSTPRS